MPQPIAADAHGMRNVNADELREAHRADPFRVRVMNVALRRAIDRAGKLKRLGLRPLRRVEPVVP